MSEVIEVTSQSRACSTAAANPRKATGLRAIATTRRRLSRRDISGAEARRPIGIRRCHHPRPRRLRRRGIDRAIGRRRRRRVGAERRHSCRVADAAGVGQDAGIGGTERNARDRRIAGTGRSRRRRQLRAGLAGHDRAGKEEAEHERRTAGHFRSPQLAAWNHEGRCMQQTSRSRVPCGEGHTRLLPE
jgi:hypothetical protein